MVCTYAMDTKGERPDPNVPEEKKTSITFETHVLTGPVIKSSPLDPVVDATVARIFSQTNVFKSAHLGWDGGKTRTHIVLFFGLVPTNQKLSIATQLLAGLTLYVFPHYSSFELKFHAVVMENGKVKKLYDDVRLIESWVEIFMTFAAPFTSTSGAVAEAGEDLVDGFLIALQKNKVLKADGEPDDAPEGPSPYKVDPTSKEGLLAQPTGPPQDPPPR